MNQETSNHHQMFPDLNNLMNWYDFLFEFDTINSAGQVNNLGFPSKSESHKFSFLRSYSFGIALA